MGNGMERKLERDGRMGEAKDGRQIVSSVNMPPRQVRSGRSLGALPGHGTSVTGPARGQRDGPAAAARRRQKRPTLRRCPAGRGLRCQQQVAPARSTAPAGACTHSAGLRDAVRSPPLRQQQVRAAGADTELRCAPPPQTLPTPAPQLRGSPVKGGAVVGALRPAALEQRHVGIQPSPGGGVSAR